MSVSVETLTGDDLVKSYSLLTSIKSIFVYKEGSDQTISEIGIEFSKRDIRTQRLFLEVAICLSKLCFENSRLIKNKATGGIVVNKNDEKQLKAYKEHAIQLANYIDNLKTFDGVYKKDLGE